MDRKTFTDIIQATFDNILRLNNTKGREYSGNDDALSNFKRAGERREIHPMDALMIYMDKHLDAINTYVRNTSKGRSQQLSEPISGRIDDAILYLLLLKGLIHESTPSMVGAGGCAVNPDRDGSCIPDTDPGLPDLQHPNPTQLSSWNSPHLHRRVNPERHGRP